ncbi:pre-mrna-splicing factor slu7 [Gossypium australe]|uniref:Pre-mrna-splicing factor slu7 n=1 Tax=Gossypium australe TaxID=47621 RepID=A0A5B6WFK1_9ROSI|nr:pre-mrna-splicing factor slu7 [Gossypium australe]
MQVDNLLKQGCEAFLAYVINLKTRSEDISDIRTVCEFFDPGLPSDRDVQLAIKVFPSTAPVSIASYRMAPTKLKELKVQLQDLLEHDFIRPSISH